MLLSYLATFSVCVLILTVLIETILSAAWNKTYFKVGIPIVVKNIHVVEHHTNIPSRSIMESKFKKLWPYPSQKFKEIDNNTYGFRNAYSFISGGAGAYGTLAFDNDNNLVVVKVFFSWSIIFLELILLIILPIGLLVDSMSFFDSTLVVIALIYFGIVFTNLVFFYYVEYILCSAVAEFASLSWTRKYINSDES